MSSGKSTKKPKAEPQPETLHEAVEVRKSALEAQLETSLNQLEDLVGGRDRLVDALAVSKHPTAKRFLSELGKTNNGGKTLYEICLKIRTSPDELLKIFTEGSLARSAVQTLEVLSSGLPSVMATAVASAQVYGPKGFQDRKLLMEVAGMHKEAGGGGININLNQMNVGGEGVFEKVISRGSSGLSKNPFDIEFEEVKEAKNG